jgi:hypothetical protein
MPDDAQPTIDENTPVPQLRDAYGRAHARATELEPLAARVPQLERENALLRAGGDPDSRVGRLLLGDDEVDWTDRTAVQSAWAEVAPAGQPAPTPPPEGENGNGSQPPPDGTERPHPQASAEELARQERREALRSGSTAPGTEPSPHPWDEAFEIRNDALRHQRPRDQANALAVDHILEAAVAGDERVLYDGSKPYSEQFEPR